MTRPTIRAARFGDVPAVYGLIADAHARSRFARFDLQEKAAKALLVNAIQRHGGDTVGSTFLAVAEGEDGLEGFILGLLQPLYFVLDALEASDLFWIARPGADARTASRLLRAMHVWAEQAPRLGLIRQGTTDAVSDHRLSGRLLRRHGMAQRGLIFEKDQAPKGGGATSGET